MALGWLAAVGCCCLLAFPGLAADLFVDQSNGDDAADGLAWTTARESIGSAITSAEVSPDPDIISVAAGRYVEQLVVPAETALLGGFPPGGGMRDPAVNRTVLDGAGAFAPVVDFPPGSDGTVLDGFVVTGGWSDRASGGGIRVKDAAPLIRNNIVEGNTACGGSGILLDYSTFRPAARLEGNIIRKSACWRIQFQCACGSAVSIEAPWDVDLGTVLSRNWITANMEGDLSTGLGFIGQGRVEHTLIEANGTGLSLYGSISLFNVTVSGNVGSGIRMACEGDYRMENVTIAENIQTGINVVQGLGLLPPMALHVSRSILWGQDDAISIAPCQHETPQVESSVVEGGYPDGTGIIDADPLFVPGPMGDYYLSQTLAGQVMTSPAVDVGILQASDLGLDARTTRTDSVGDEGVVDLGFHYPAVAALTVERGTNSAALTPHRSVTALPFTDDAGTLSDPLLPLLFYRIPEACNQLGVEKDLVGDSTRLIFLSGP